MKRIIIMAENTVGVIADISTALAADGINIESLNTDNIDDSGVVILTTDDSDRALYSLGRAGFKAVSDEALIIKLKDEPGALAKVAEKFKLAKINIRSMHILNRQGGYTMVALSVADKEKAAALIDAQCII